MAKLSASFDMSISVTETHLWDDIIALLYKQADKDPEFKQELEALLAQHQVARLGGKAE